MNQEKVFFQIYILTIIKINNITEIHTTTIFKWIYLLIILKLMSLSVNNLSISSSDGTWKPFTAVAIVTVACKWCVPPSAADVFLSKNDNSSGKPVRFPRGWNMIFISADYAFRPVWSRVLIFTHCPIKLV
jgi:hypothetical protein